MAHPRLQTVRQRYNFCCGYCGVSETDAGGDLTVDHFHPASAGGSDQIDNLVYACVRCNQYKGVLLPEATDMAQERRLLHPLRDTMRAHIREDEPTSRLAALTPTGAFHITSLRLNRPALIANRQRRHLVALLQARLEQALSENQDMQDRMDRRDRYVITLEERLDRLTEPEQS